MKYPDRCQYTMLITSLPQHKTDLFDEHQLPISRIQLNKRLSLLGEQHTIELAKIESLLHWSHIKQPFAPLFVEQALASIGSINNLFIKNIIIWRLKLRVILAALRMRHLGQKEPPGKKIFGFDYGYFMMHKHWHQPDLGLAKQLPWLEQANQLLIDQKNLDLEKLLFGVVWDHYHQQSFGHYFNFEAVIIYVLRWDLVFRWTNYNQAQALERFDKLLSKTLEDQDGLL